MMTGDSTNPTFEVTGRTASALLFEVMFPCYSLFNDYGFLTLVIVEIINRRITC